ncbi:MAG: hypothetical protein HKO05_11235 [Erythrobacter sp.]|nr:hypothetical protein [Erythrobacter sp.]RZV34654.1 MAG: hypothetical protein EX262_03990 [Sphingomonadaceae bacterium]
MARKFRPRCVATTLAFCLAAGGQFYAAPAQAQVAFQGASPALLATVAGIACNSQIASAAAMASPVATTVQASKRAAILGGEMSALDRIRMQQQGSESAVALAVPATIGEGLAPAAGGVRPADTLACAGNGAGLIPSGLRTPIRTYETDDFLASKKVRIGKTSMDREWNRVRRETVGGTLRRNFGRRVDPTLATVDRVNRWVNKTITYVEDRDLFRKADFWAGANLTLRLGKGDCEDYALTKMQLLAAAGIAREDMFLTIARDRVRNADHALLVVKIEGRYVVLDNATDDLLDGTSSHDYAPVLSFNDREAWLHGY